MTPLDKLERESARIAAEAEHEQSIMREREATQHTPEPPLEQIRQLAVQLCDATGNSLEDCDGCTIQALVRQVYARLSALDEQEPTR